MGDTAGQESVAGVGRVAAQKEAKRGEKRKRSEEERDEENEEQGVACDGFAEEVNQDEEVVSEEQPQHQRLSHKPKRVRFADEDEDPELERDERVDSGEGAGPPTLEQYVRLQVRAGEEQAKAVAAMAFSYDESTTGEGAELMEKLRQRLCRPPTTQSDEDLFDEAKYETLDSLREAMKTVKRENKVKRVEKSRAVIMARHLGLNLEFVYQDRHLQRQLVRSAQRLQETLQHTKKKHGDEHDSGDRRKCPGSGS